jgi:hypothetical protein
MVTSLQVGAGGLRSNTAQKAPMTMEEILQVRMMLTHTHLQ